MNKCDCENCVCLLEGWVCDELQKPIAEIENCPEED